MALGRSSPSDAPANPRSGTDCRSELKTAVMGAESYPHGILKSLRRSSLLGRPNAQHHRRLQRHALQLVATHPPIVFGLVRLDAQKDLGSGPEFALLERYGFCLETDTADDSQPIGAGEHPEL